MKHIARILVILLGLGYILSPIDGVPDIVPVVGWIDDGVASLVVLATGLSETWSLIRPQLPGGNKREILEAKARQVK